MELSIGLVVEMFKRTQAFCTLDLVPETSARKRSTARDHAKGEKRARVTEREVDSMVAKREMNADVKDAQTWRAYLAYV